jgi:hypothetical protein
MRHLLHLVSLGVLFLVGAHAQDKKSPAPPVVRESVFYPLPQEEHSKVRDLEYQKDQLEIENQKLQVEIDRVAIENQKKIVANHDRQQAILDQIRAIAATFAQAKHVDTEKFEFDLSTVRFREIQPAK